MFESTICTIASSFVNSFIVTGMLVIPNSLHASTRLCPLIISYLPKEYVLSKQVLRSGTSIGANAKEAAHAQSKADFYAKMYISYKEANETEYWLELLYESGYIEKAAFDSIYSDCKEIIKILTLITKTMKTNYEK